MGRGILLWLLGVPIPIIIIIALLYHWTPLRSRASLSISEEIFFMSNAVLNARSDAILNAARRTHRESRKAAASAVSWRAACIIGGCGCRISAGSCAVDAWRWHWPLRVRLAVVQQQRLRSRPSVFSPRPGSSLFELFASGVGGYLGRVACARVARLSVHTDEVYFRDTAHGLIVWGVGAIVTAWLLTSGAASVVSGARAHAGGSAC